MWLPHRLNVNKSIDRSRQGEPPPPSALLYESDRCPCAINVVWRADSLITRVYTAQVILGWFVMVDFVRLSFTIRSTVLLRYKVSFYY